MADLITVSAVDIDRADKFLTSYMTSAIPEADFSEGGVMRDFAIKAIAYIFAFFRNEAEDVRAHLSLLKLSEMEESESVADAVDSLLSNWFLTRKEGNLAHLPTTLHFSQAVDVTIVPTARFFRTSSLVYTTGLTQSLVISASSMRPTLNADGTVADYTCNVTLIAEKVGTEYNTTPGRFISADPFNPYFTYAENTSDGYDGKSIETTAELLSRAQTAISVRNLINQRSIDAVLRDTFSLSFVRTIGYGDPEMMRDFVVDGINHLRMHIGGCSDIFVSLNRTDYVETLDIGAAFARPDNKIVLLRDALTDLSSVTPGDVIYVRSGLPNAPSTYLVTEAMLHALAISRFAPFEVSTEETGGEVSYSVGKFQPNYEDVVTARVGQTSRTFQQDGCVLLKGQPHYRINSVEVVPTVGDPLLLQRLNTLSDPDVPAGKFYVRSLEPLVAQSDQEGLIIQVNATAYVKAKLRISYETLVGYSDIASFVADPYERVNNANQLVRGLHPVYLKFNIKYATALDASVPVDEDAVRKSLVDFVNTWNISKPLSSSEIVKYLKATYPELGTIYSPLSLTYELQAPDGQVYQFETRDVVSVVPDYTMNRAYLTNGTDLRNEIINADLDPDVVDNRDLIDVANAALNSQFVVLGISDRTIRYIATAEEVTLTKVV